MDNMLAISVTEAAAALGISRSAAYQAAREGKLPTRKVGRRILVPVSALQRWLDTDKIST